MNPEDLDAMPLKMYQVSPNLIVANHTFIEFHQVIPGDNCLRCSESIAPVYAPDTMGERYLCPECDMAYMFSDGVDPAEWAITTALLYAAKVAGELKEVGVPEDFEPQMSILVADDSDSDDNWPEPEADEA